MSLLKCKMCGGTMETIEGTTVAQCEYCGTKQTVPRLNDERKANLYDRANHFRRNNEYDKAMSIYERILDEDSSDAEAYWSLVLCRYGVEYVEDPLTGKRIPTVNRTQFQSIFSDPDYKATLEYADAYQKALYEAEARQIDDIQKGILEISSREDPFDVFICYKETDEQGRRTRDSVLATELYHQLKKEGFKVFFSRITLEDKLGTAYEPYIFAALNSAKVMVVLGTKPEFFNAVWVKNEWSRYLTLIKNGAKKTLIPAYRDMDPYDLPEEFSHLQAQDMSKLGFMQDLMRGIKKIAESTGENDSGKSSTPNPSVNLESLMKRAYMFLEDGDWESANRYCERILDQDPENSQAYLCKLLAEFKVSSIDSLATVTQPINESANYKRIMRHADDELKQRIRAVNAAVSQNIAVENENKRKEGIYQEALKLQQYGRYDEAINKFSSIIFYRDARDQLERCRQKIDEYKQQENYYIAVKQMEYDSVAVLSQAKATFESMIGYKDSRDHLFACNQKIAELKKQEEKKNRKGIKGIFKK